MYGKATLLLERRPQALTLPASALLVEGEKKYALVVSNGALAKRQLTPDWTTVGWSRS